MRQTRGIERTELARRITQLAQLEGTFVLRSGVTADVYFDKYQFESDPATLAMITARLVPLIPDGTELLAGLELGGIPIATAFRLQPASQLFLFANRPSPTAPPSWPRGPTLLANNCWWSKMS